MNILILGANGQVGWELQRSLSPIGMVRAIDRAEVEFENLDGLRAFVSMQKPDVIVNAAAYTAVDKAEAEPEKAGLINAQAVAVLAEEARRYGSWLIHYSTDYVFDGTSAGAYVESDETNPLNVYGRTKLQGEHYVREAGCKHLIFRTSWVYASRGQNFIKTMLRLAKERDELKVISDQVGAPTHAELIADVTALAVHRCLYEIGPHNEQLSGTYHLVAAGETNWYEYARLVLQLAENWGVELRVKGSDILPIPSEAYPAAAMRPKNSRLNCDKLERTFKLKMPDWERQVTRTVNAMVERDL